MSIKCNRCGIQFDSPFCPNCGAPAQPQLNNQPYPNIHPPIKRKYGCLFWGLIGLGGGILLLIFIMLLSVFIYGIIDGYKEGASTSINEAVVSESVDDANPSPTIIIAPGDYLTEDEIQYLYSDPEKYIDRRVRISGMVFRDPEKDEDGVYFQMYQDASNSENNTVVAYYGKINIKDGDYIIIDGIVHDKFEGENLLGGSISVPSIIADKIEISTYQDVVSPTKKVIDINETQEQFGYEVTVEKIEFSPIETRVYISVNNNGDGSFTVHSFNMKILQGKQQYKEQDNWKADYPELQTDMMPGTITSGVVCFPVISQTDDITLYIDGRSDNWEEDMKEYKFSVKAQ